jgi:hypothetical protein
VPEQTSELLTGFGCDQTGIGDETKEAAAFNPFSPSGLSAFDSAASRVLCRAFLRMLSNQKPIKGCQSSLTRNDTGLSGFAFWSSVARTPSRK